jgi:hypothetical protein
MLSEFRARLAQRHYLATREMLQARIAKGEVSEDTDISSVFESLDLVEIEMEAEELGMDTLVPIRTVGDLLWLLKAIELRINRKKVKVTG